MNKVALIVGGLGVFAGSAYLANQFTKKKEEPTFSLKDLGYIPQQEGIKIFDKIAPKYDSKVNFDERLTGILTNRKKILEHVKGPDVLEVAIGTGRNLEFYPPNTRIVGIDLSEGMLEQVKSKIQKLFGTKNEKNIQVTTVLMDAHNMKFQDNQFDTVVDTFGLCSFENATQVLKEMQRVCKPDGKIILLEHGEAENKTSMVAKRLENRAEKHAHAFGCNWNKPIEQIVHESGLEIIELKRESFGTEYHIIGRPKKQQSQNLSPSSATPANV